MGDALPLAACGLRLRSMRVRCDYLRRLPEDVDYGRLFPALLGWHGVEPGAVIDVQHHGCGCVSVWPVYGTLSFGEPDTRPTHHGGFA